VKEHVQPYGGSLPALEVHSQSADVLHRRAGLPVHVRPQRRVAPVEHEADPQPREEDLVAIGEAKHLWHVQKRDFFLWVLAFLGTLFLGVLFGLLVAVGASLVIVLYESVRPQIAVLWKLPGTAIYRNVKQGESPGQFVRGVLVLRVARLARLFFLFIDGPARLLSLVGVPLAAALASTDICCLLSSWPPGCGITRPGTSVG